jgi:uncharacterized membrane protein
VSLSITSSIGVLIISDTFISVTPYDCKKLSTYQAYGVCSFFFKKTPVPFFPNFIFLFWNTIFNQENHVHATAAACKKTDAGYVERL